MPVESKNDAPLNAERIASWDQWVAFMESEKEALRVEQAAFQAKQAAFQKQQDATFQEYLDAPQQEGLLGKLMSKMKGINPSTPSSKSDIATPQSMRSISSISPKVPPPPPPLPAHLAANVEQPQPPVVLAAPPLTPGYKLSGTPMVGYTTGGKRKAYQEEDYGEPVAFKPVTNVVTLASQVAEAKIAALEEQYSCDLSVKGIKAAKIAYATLVEDTIPRLEFELQHSHAREKELASKKPLHQRAKEYRRLARASTNVDPSLRAPRASKTEQEKADDRVEAARRSYERAQDEARSMRNTRSST